MPDKTTQCKVMCIMFTHWDWKVGFQSFRKYTFYLFIYCFW